MKLMIDECLSDQLATLARDNGHPESSHVRWIGKGGAKDWALLPVILDGDWTFVTRNAIDFRGPGNAPGSNGEYQKAPLHAGLVCLNGPVGMDLDMQIEMFGVVLKSIQADGDMINKILEITFLDPRDPDFVVVRYGLPVE